MTGELNGAPVRSPPPSDSLRLSLDAPERVGPGEKAPLTLQVENVSGRSLDLYLRGRTIAFDLVVTDEEGDPVWSRLHDEIIPAILRVEHLAAGDTLVLRDAWDGRTDAGESAPPGRYRVQGVLLTEGEPLRTPIRSLRVEAEGDGKEAS